MPKKILKFKKRCLRISKCFKVLKVFRVTTIPTQVWFKTGRMPNIWLNSCGIMMVKSFKRWEIIQNQSRWPEPYFPAPCLRCMCPWWIVSMMSVNLLKICLCENLCIFCKTSVAYFFTDIMSAPDFQCLYNCFVIMICVLSERGFEIAASKPFGKRFSDFLSRRQEFNKYISKLDAKYIFGN